MINMSLQGVITQDIPNATQSISFVNPTVLDSITYSSVGLTYPVAGSYTLSQTDFNLWITYKTQFYTSLFVSFPNISLNNLKEVSAAQIRLLSTTGPNLYTYNQTTTGAYNLVYNITFDRNAKTVSFQARTAGVTITAQEYLMAYPILMQFANQVAIYK